MRTHDQISRSDHCGCRSLLGLWDAATRQPLACLRTAHLRVSRTFDTQAPWPSSSRHASAAHERTRDESTNSKGTGRHDVAVIV